MSLQRSASMSKVAVIVLPSVFLLLLFRMALEMAQNVSTAISKYVKGCYDCATQCFFVVVVQNGSRNVSECLYSDQQVCQRLL